MQDERAESTWVVEVQGFGQIRSGLRVEAASEAQAIARGLEACGISVSAGPSLTSAEALARELGTAEQA